MPVLHLPNDPSLENLKARAKTLQRQVLAGDQEALGLVTEFHPRLGSLAPGDPPPAAFFLADAQLVIARRYGFASWTRLRRHLDVVAEYTWSPPTEPAAPGADLADEFLRLACLTYEGDDPSWRGRARRLLASHPEIADASICTASAVGEWAAVSVRLNQDPGLARQRGGPYGWEPLMYAAYSRLDSTAPGHSTLEVARLLLEAGADPNAGCLWRGMPSPFTVLTGAFGNGEGGPPPHQHALQLATLLLEAGADPNDSQALYNCSPGFTSPGDDGYLRLLLRYGLGSGSGDPWHARLAPAHPTPRELLDDELLKAAAGNLPERARLLLAHGADPAGTGTRHPVFGGHDARELAVMNGNAEVLDVLAAAGAGPDDPVLALLGACMSGDRARVRQLLERDSSLAAAAVTREPDLIVRAAGLGRSDAVRLLAGIGFDVNVLSRAGARTGGLHEAAWTGNLSLVRLLLKLGADPQLRDLNHDATARGWAEYNHQDEVARFLAGLDP